MTVNYSIIPRRGTGEVLLVREPGGWSLPGHSLPGAAEINADLARRFGLEVVLTGFVQQFVDEDRGLWFVFAHENASAAEPAGGARWVGPAELAGLDLAEPRLRAVLAEWFAETSDGVSPLGHLPWARAGWLDEVDAWVRERLAAHGLTATGRVEQSHSQPWSCVSRVTTSTGAAYLKAVPASLDHEPRLTAALADWFPETLPRVLAVDETRHWLLTEDVGPFDEYVATAEHAARFEPVLATVAAMQRDTATRTGDLLALGCPDRRPAALPGLFADLLADTGQFLIGQDGGLTAQDHDRLVAYLPAFERTCALLADAGLPDTLHHDDCGAGNIAFARTRTVIFDWGESAVAHPFFSLRAFLRDVGDERARDRLRTAYLREWGDHGSPERLAGIYELTAAPAALCRALSWRAALAALGERRPFVYRYVMARAVRQLVPFAVELSEGVRA